MEIVFTNYVQYILFSQKKPSQNSLFPLIFLRCRVAVLSWSGWSTVVAKLSRAKWLAVKNIYMEDGRNSVEIRGLRREHAFSDLLAMPNGSSQV